MLKEKEGLNKSAHARACNLKKATACFWTLQESNQKESYMKLEELLWAMFPSKKPRKTNFR